MAAGHAVSILKSHVPNLNISLISQGYICDKDDAGRLFEDSLLMIELFVEKLNLSVGNDDEESTFSCSCNISNISTAHRLER